MILDFHTHNFRGQTDAVAADALRCGVDFFVFLGDVFRYGDDPNPEQVTEINDDTLQSVRRYADRTAGFCFLNPKLPGDLVQAELRRCLELPEFRGAKLEVSLNCRSPKLDPLMEVLEAYDRPLLHHCWYKTVEKHAEESDPSDVAHLARRFPRVRIVMAHLVACGIRGVEDIADCPNVMVDTSGAQPEAGFIEYAVNRIGADRLLYGSDAPCRDFRTQLAKVREADIAESDREKIFWKNAVELLKC